MSFSLTVVDAEATAIIAELPDSFSWKGNPYVCAATVRNKGNRLDAGGLILAPSVELLVRTALFTGTRPKASDEVTFHSDVLRVSSVETSQDDLTLTLTCVGDLNEG